MRRSTFVLGALALMAGSLLPVGGSIAQEAETPQALVDRAAAVVTELKAEERYGDFAPYMQKAKAVLIVPQLLKAGFIVGGEFGDGVMLTRTMDGGWSAPAFYSMAGGSIGLQVGAESKRVLIAIMTEKGVNALLTDQFKVGADASISVGEVGGGASASSVGSLDKADMVAFSRSKGLFGGGALDGTLIRPNPEKNAAYYGAGTTTRDILIGRTVTASGAAGLQSALSRR
ncbi:MAG: lipid-binding SYLF domain-containing protein [Thalassobaculum sp.]|uniref:lipid-binding SYLF domain-containing protein n=1 Tax=Thalassobaculum sp. TaxID=2022740 RepID=UPI0032F04725